MEKEKMTLWAFWAGTVIVVGSHLYMLVLGLPSNQVVPHSILNLVAAGLYGYAWFGRT